MWIMENDPECLYLTFSVDEEVFGMVSSVILSLAKFADELCSDSTTDSAYGGCYIYLNN